MGNFQALLREYGEILMEQYAPWLQDKYYMKPEKCLNLLHVTGLETQFRFVYCLSVPRLRPTVTICWKL